MTTSLTIHQIDKQLVEKLESEAARRGVDVDRVVSDALARSFPLASSPTKKRDLSHFAGTWTQEEYEEFKQNTVCFEKIDEELWR